MLFRSVFMLLRRRSTSELLELGIGDQRPVHLLVQVPPIPRGYLRALIEDAGGAPVRLLLGTDMSYVRLNLVLGPLPRNWHGPFQDRDKALRSGAHKAQVLSRALGTEALLIAQQGRQAFALFMPFPPGGAAQAIPHLLSSDVLASIALPALGVDLGLFDTDLPPECLEILGDKPIRDALHPYRASLAQPAAGPKRPTGATGGRPPGQP